MNCLNLPDWQVKNASQRLTTIPSKVFLRRRPSNRRSRECYARDFGALGLYISIRVFNLLEKSLDIDLMDPIASYYSDLPMNLRFVKLNHHYSIISTDSNPQRMYDDAHL